LKGSYRAAIDFPAAFYWRELMEVFPEALVVLGTRDPNSWPKSVAESIFYQSKANHSFPVNFVSYFLGKYQQYKVKELFINL